MVGTTLDLENIGEPDLLAVEIAEKFQSWELFRQQWQQEKKEIRHYLFAIDTSTTSNKTNPWKNSTTTPKLTQLRDNLHANYMAALFPNDNWFRWEGDDEDAESEQKRLAIQKYMENKIVNGFFKREVSKLVYDYIDYGNVFGTSDWVEERIVDEETGEEQLGFIGPKAMRVSPLDLTFNPVASEFAKSPVIHRTVVTMGELRKNMESNPGDETAKKMFDMAMEKALNNRRSTAGMSLGDNDKQDAFVIDGFGTLHEYYQSGYVEVLDFYGDLYDLHTDEFLENHHIRIIDRMHVIVKEPIKRLTFGAKFHHTGWRTRPDNLYAMGPLDNLVGLQYRIDHLENLKADVFDLIAHPVLKVRGTVEEFVWRPGEKIILGDDGDVEMLVPETTALNADLQIANIMNLMEEMAGAPKQAMGIRTPGEKTAFEVQALENAAGRIFQQKITQFEEEILQPLLNDMLEQARRNLDGSDIIRVLDDTVDAVLFQEISAEDLKAKGKLRPVGASHFARRANILQNLVQISNTPLLQDPLVGVHISGIKRAKLIEDLLNMDRFGLVSENIAIIEQADTQRLVQSTQENLAVEEATPAGITADDQGAI
jgi:hypothetical protein